MQELNDKINWRDIFGAYEHQSIVDAKILEMVDNGYKLDVLGMESFLPLLNKALGYDNPEALVGKTLPVCITKLKPLNREIVVSYAKAEKLEIQEQAKEAMKEIAVGDIFDGTIKNITSYGLFVTIAPGVDGLVHVKEVSYSKLDLSAAFQVGDKIRVKVIGIAGKKISLSHKQLYSDPWDTLEAGIIPGAIVDGVVNDVQDYGAFVRIKDGVEGLLHKSEINWIPQVSVRDLYHKGDRVKAKVLTLDRAKHKLTLSVKQLTDDPWKNIDSRYHVGDAVNCKILNSERLGLRVSINDNIEGIISSPLKVNTKSIRGIITEIDHESRIVKLIQNTKSVILENTVRKDSAKGATENRYSISDIKQHFKDILAAGRSGIPKARIEAQSLLINCGDTDYFWSFINVLIDMDWNIFRGPVGDVFNDGIDQNKFRPSVRVMDAFVDRIFAYKDKPIQNINLVYPFKDVLSPEAKEIVYKEIGELSDPMAYRKLMEILGNDLTWNVEYLLRIDSPASLYALFELLKTNIENKVEGDSNRLLYIILNKLDKSQSSRMIGDVIRDEFLDDAPLYLTPYEIQTIKIGGFGAFYKIQSRKKNLKKFNKAVNNIGSYIGKTVSCRVCQKYKSYCLLSYSEHSVLVQNSWLSKNYGIGDSVSLTITSAYIRFNLMVGYESKQLYERIKPVPLLDLGSIVEVKFSKRGADFLCELKHGYSKINIHVARYPADFDYKKTYRAVVMYRNSFLSYEVVLKNRI